MSTTNHNRIVQPHLVFNGSCEQAVEFYRKALGAEVEMMMRFKENPDPMPPGMLAPGFENKVMHAALRIGGGVMMASDGMGAGETNFKGFSLAVYATDEAGVDRMFNALVEGGSVTMPLGKTFWSPRFGMVTDRFGVKWMINSEH